MSTITTGTSVGGGLLYDSDTTGNLVIKTGVSATTTATFHSNLDTVFAGNIHVNNIYGKTLTAGTANTSISGGTVVPFTSIPSSAKRITVMFSGVSTGGTSNPLVQVGTGGSATTSGYSGSAFNMNTSGATATYTTGFGLLYAHASNIINGHMVITLVTGNRWVASYTFGATGDGSQGGTCVGGGGVTLAGALDYLRVTTVNGTDAFDAGTINIMWE